MEMKHPIDGLMVTAMNSIKEMIDVNTIIGDPIQALNNTVIIPISKVGFGFAAGGCEFNDETVNSYNRKEKEENINYRLPFGGGSGAGVNITPVAFLIVQNDSVKLLEATHSSVLDKLVEYVPDAIEKINQLFNKKLDNEKKEDEYEEYYDDDLDWDDEDDFNDENLEDEKSENEEGDNNYSNEENDVNKQNEYDIEIEKEEYSTKQGKNGNNKKIKEKIIKKKTDKKTDDPVETNKEKSNTKINSKEKKLESKIKSIIVDNDDEDDD